MNRIVYKIMSFLALYIMCSFYAFAQDYIAVKNSENLTVTILRMDSSKVYFKQFESIDTVQYFILKENITLIAFASNVLKKVNDLSFKSEPTFKPVNKIIAPDYIYPIGGEMIQSIIDYISEDQVQFHLAYANDTNTYFLKKSEIEKITFKEVLNSSSAKESEMSDMELASKGRSDAYQNYDGYKPAAVGSFVAGIFGIYLIPAVVPLVLSVTPPMDENLGVINNKLSQKPAYMNSYAKTAKSIKSNKVWSNFGYGALTSIGLLFGFAILVTTVYR